MIVGIFLTENGDFSLSDFFVSSNEEKSEHVWDDINKTHSGIPNDVIIIYNCE